MTTGDLHPDVAYWDADCQPVTYDELGHELRAEPVARNPEQDTIEAIDDLIDEQIRLGERWASGDDRCPLCGCAWHGLRGDGQAYMITEGTPGAESYPQVGNGGALGCPGAHAISAARIRWRYRYSYPGPFLWETSRPQPFVDQVNGVRWSLDQHGLQLLRDGVLLGPGGGGGSGEATAIGYGGGGGCFADPARHTHICRLDVNGRCVWANCPRGGNAELEDTVLAFDAASRSWTPQPRELAPIIRVFDARMRELVNPMERMRRAIQQIIDALAHVIGFDISAWLPEPEPPPDPVPLPSALANVHFYGVVTDAENPAGMQATLEITGDEGIAQIPLPAQPFPWRPVVYARPVDRSGIAGPTGTVLPFLADGTLDAEGLADAGFHPIGTIAPGTWHLDDGTNIVEAPVMCDDGHCYCDHPYRCRWNRRDGPQPPVRDTPHGQPPAAIGARRARRQATRRPSFAVDRVEVTETADTLTAEASITPRDGGWTITDLFELRNRLWEHR